MSPDQGREGRQRAGGGRPAGAKKILVLGATGCVGSALIPELLARGVEVRAGSRHPRPATGQGKAPPGSVESVRCDLQQPDSLRSALSGVDAAYYLVHSIGQGSDYAARELEGARAFIQAAEAEGVGRIIYLGGVAPAGAASVHLRSRLAVGEILRSGKVPTLELRAAMIIAAGSASWQIVRDLAMRLPAMLLPAWLGSRMQPLALADAVTALADGLELPLEHSAWFDLPGPERMSGKQILERVAALHGRRVPSVGVPVLTPALSALWLRLISRADFKVARELVAGMTGDLLPRDARYWELTHHGPLVPFDAAAQEALRRDRRRRGVAGIFAEVEEQLVRALGQALPRRRRPA